MPSFIDRISYPLSVGVLIVVTVFAIVRAARGRRGVDPWVVGALVAWLAATGFLVLRRGSSERLNLIPFDYGDTATAFDPVFNVLLFVPLGILLATLSWRILPALGLALAVSLSIEVTQYVTDRGRSADVNDLIANTVGAALGWLFVLAIRRRSTGSAT